MKPGRRILAVLTLVIAGGVSTAVGGTTERKVYAHFMGCWPAFGCSGQDGDMKAWLLTGEAKGDGAQGGLFNNFPLVPQSGYDVPLLEKAKMEIKRAKRAGIDGFAFDAWAGDKSPQTLDVYFHAAEELKVDFGLTICFDPGCHGARWIEGTNMWERFASSAKWVLRHVDSPNLARFHGKPLFFGYHSRGISNVSGLPLDEQRRIVKECWQKWRKALPCEVYLHGSVEGLVNCRQPEKNDYAAIAKDFAETFDAVGAFTGADEGYYYNCDIWKYVKAAGCGWSQPLLPQYCHKGRANNGGAILTAAGLDMMRKCWTTAIERGSELLQFVTWNDYGEETILAPAYGSNYTFMRVNRHYAELWKTGREPIVEKDEVHVAFRRCCDPKTTTFPFLDRRTNLPTALEVITFLTKPSRVVVEGYGEYEAPAGMFFKQFDERPGKVSVKVSRRDWMFRSRVVCQLTAPEEIGAKKWREDDVAATWSSTYDEEWATDFPGVKPLYYSENGDIDGDGLPNWFEMVYFGEFPYMDTATCADPDADPDKDGLTNMQEYEGDTNPLVADEPYAEGYVWSLKALAGRKLIGNPARDAKGRYVWRCEIQHGEKGHDYVPGSMFREIPSGGGSLRRQMMRDYMPNKLGGGGFDTGLQFNKPQPGQAELRVHRDSPIALTWIAPVACSVDVVTKVTPQNPKVKVRTTLVKGDRVLGAAVARGVNIEKGDEIRLVVENRNPWSGGDMFTIDTFDVVWTRENQLEVK